MGTPYSYTENGSTFFTGTNDGFTLARKDLELRGPGEVLGMRQAGIPELRIAHIVKDEDLMQPARSEALRESDGSPA